MENYLFVKRSTELESLSTELGYGTTYFLEDIVIIKNGSKKEILKQCKGNKIKIFKPATEELLRFALEKTPIDIVYGIEEINPRDSTHYVRGGLDQVVCKIAAANKKIIGFSYADLINSKDKANVLARIRLNLKLCTKYGVKTVVASFGTELRARKDVERMVGRVYQL